MPVHNADIAAAFDEIADLLELQNANPFRIRAYRNAARVAGELRFDSTASARRAAAGWRRRTCSIPALWPLCGACSIDDEADFHVDAVPNACCASEARAPGSVILDARHRFLGGCAGVRINPFRDADLGFGFRDRFARLVIGDFESRGFRLGFGQGRVRPVFLAAVASLPVHAVRALDEIDAALVRGRRFAVAAARGFPGLGHDGPLYARRAVLRRPVPLFYLAGPVL